jgi:hypothetical protein
MKILNSHSENKHFIKSWGVLVPTICIDYSRESVFSGKVYITKISFPTLFCLQVTKRSIVLKLSLLGLGVYLEHRQKK